MLHSILECLFLFVFLSATPVDPLLLGSQPDSCFALSTSLPLRFRPIRYHLVTLAGELQNILALRALQVHIVILFPVKREKEELTALGAEPLSFHHLDGFSFPLSTIFFPVLSEPRNVGVVTARHKRK